MRIRLEFRPCSLWVGVACRRRYAATSVPDGVNYYSDDLGDLILATCGVKTTQPRRRFDVWVCLLPCFPVRFTWFRDG